MSETTQKITARHMNASERIEHKLIGIMREIDKMPTRTHLMAVVGAAGAFWAVVVVIAVELMR